LVGAGNLDLIKQRQRLSAASLCHGSKDQDQNAERHIIGSLAYRFE
jgi:hypothetical protein